MVWRRLQEELPSSIRSGGQKWWSGGVKDSEGETGDEELPPASDLDESFDEVVEVASEEAELFLAVGIADAEPAGPVFIQDLKSVQALQGLPYGASSVMLLNIL